MKSQCLFVSQLSESEIEARGRGRSTGQFKVIFPKPVFFEINLSQFLLKIFK